MPSQAQETNDNHHLIPVRFDPGRPKYLAYMALLAAKTAQAKALVAYEQATRDLIQAEADFEYLKSISRKH